MSNNGSYRRTPWGREKSSFKRKRSPIIFEYPNARRQANIQIEEGDHGSTERSNNNLSNVKSFNTFFRGQEFPMSFKVLEEITNSDIKDIVPKLNNKKNSFVKLLNTNINKDMFVLIIELISKVCESNFAQLKLNLLLELDICNSNLILNLRNYLMDLPYEEDKSKNNLYWMKENNFWKNFISFFDCLLNISPSTVLLKCRSLIEATTKCCLDGLKEKHNYVLPVEYELKMVQLRERLQTSAAEKEHQPKTELSGKPPENFRELSVVPCREDLLDERPFLRPNIVEGGYSDIEHYLDVQFRLLREDCFGPLREGILQYMKDPKRKKIDNIRVYQNVKFVGPYITNTKLGTLVQLEEKTIKWLRRIQLAHSKRFIFGSLLLFTKDSGESFIVATILDRDIKLLSRGQIPISIVDKGGQSDFSNGNYTMIESEVYFEPYYHVMKALQDPKFPDHLAMSKYIVKVDPEPSPPSFIHADTVIEIQSEAKSHKCIVLKNDTWPSPEKLGLNESQYEAFRLALTHEFAVIQGPPGSGKTYLGVQVAKTLIKNFVSKEDHSQMLVICYTNHALDQFLEALIPVTDSIVRIGGQSRNEALNKYNLNNLRRGQFQPRRIDGTDTRTYSQKQYYREKYNLNSTVFQLRKEFIRIDSLQNVVFSYNTIKAYVEECQIIGRMYRSEDPLGQWLFENVDSYNFSSILSDYEARKKNEGSYNHNEVYANRREEVIIDNYESEDFDVTNDILFSLSLAVKELDRLISLWKKYRRYELQTQIVNFKSHIELYKNMSAHRNREPQVNIAKVLNPRRIPTIERWSLYFKWAKVVMNDAMKKITPLQQSLEMSSLCYEEARMMVDIDVIREKKVIGMTTSGAARLRKLLETLAPSIVIVEEAAEVLEAHIITSLTNKCKHLILIGDHQQLRPSAASMKLARRYKMEVSLFERMIINKVHSRRLNVQHRMRPEISALIVPHIYPDLQNHASVETFPNVKGISKNVYFFTHNHKEEEVDDNSSRSNHQEADLVLRLAVYLMLQGYQPEDITILAAYSGQMFYMKRQINQYLHLNGVKITVVDNYQGEESKIILLSLVRNNSEDKIGFLGQENRICVALSRAREGLYIFGNINMLKRKSEVWKKIGTQLETNASVGSTLLLRCDRHINQETEVSTLKDFDKVPEGGCQLFCNTEMPCGHICRLVCHGYDHGHQQIKCRDNCKRTCESGHVCSLMCWQTCNPCNVKVEKKLPCEHIQVVDCHKKVEDVKCETVVTVTLPDCGHTVLKPCNVKIKSAVCLEPCNYRVDSCGHTCARTCHVNNDPDHEKYKCPKPCARAKNGCTADLEGDRGKHQCQKRCFEKCKDCEVKVRKARSTCAHTQLVACNQNINEIPCEQQCGRTLPCNHICKRSCYKQCNNCFVKVTKIIPKCNHEIILECSTEVKHELCSHDCEKRLPCGHPCAERCGKECDEEKCTEKVNTEYEAVCGHKIIDLPCNVFRSLINGTKEKEYALTYCQQPCTQILECGHQCRGTCAECLQGRLHQSCRQVCQQTNICGHQCMDPCNQLCQPCNRPCEVRCSHSYCRRSCGAPCVPCQEKCERNCRHGRCVNRCGQPCSRKPCNEKCKKKLSCGHVCRGLCGEPCLQLCPQCHRDTFPKDLLGDDYHESDMFIQLQDCSHILEVTDMDSWMNSEGEGVHARTCPLCRTPVINTYRYKDLVNKRMKTEINPVKERIYGNQVDIINKRILVSEKLIDLQKVYVPILKDNQSWKNAFEKIERVVSKQRKVSLLKLQMQSVYLEIMDLISECYQKFSQSSLTELKKEMIDHVSLICNFMAKNTHKLSQQQQRDVQNEIKRLNGIVQLSKILSPGIPMTSEVIEARDEAKTAVFTWQPFNEDVALQAIKKVKDKANMFGVITKQERDFVIKAIGAKAGSWYKCPNGHFYNITLCGGAMQVAKCIECNAQIGGQNHRLLSDNAHAPEIDNSRYPAWSSHNDNMRNYRF